MVLLEYQYIPSAIGEDRKMDIAAEDTGVLQYSYFEMPVRLQVNNVELLQIPAELDERLRTGERSGASPNLSPIPWLELPLLGVAIGYLDALHEAIQKGSSSYMLPDYVWKLHFRQSDSNIEIRSSVNNQTITVDYRQLLEAFEKFATDVKSMLKQEVPELQDHPVIGQWLL